MCGFLDGEGEGRIGMAEGDKIGREATREEEETNFGMKDFNANNRILFCKKSPDPQRMLVSQLTQPQSQFNANQSIQIKMSPLSPQPS